MVVSYKTCILEEMDTDSRGGGGGGGDGGGVPFTLTSHNSAICKLLQL